METVNNQEKNLIFFDFKLIINYYRMPLVFSGWFFGNGNDLEFLFSFSPLTQGKYMSQFYF